MAHRVEAGTEAAPTLWRDGLESTTRPVTDRSPLPVREGSKSSSARDGEDGVTRVSPSLLIHQEGEVDVGRDGAIVVGSVSACSV